MSIRIDRPGKIQKVALGKMVVSEQAQRELKPHRVKAMLKDFDIDLIGMPVLNFRDGTYFIIDGQHRVVVLKRWLGEGWEPQQIECRVHTELTEAQEADMFLDLNNVLTVTAFDKFKVAVTAGRPTETAIKRIVEEQGLRIAASKSPNAVGAVSVLMKTYLRAGEMVLGSALRIIRDAYPEAPFDAVVIDGMGRFCERYNSILDEVAVKKKLGSVRGGITTLLAKAEVLHKGTQQCRPACVAAAAVDIVNSKRGGNKLPSWWINGDKA